MGLGWCTAYYTEEVSLCIASTTVLLVDLPTTAGICVPYWIYDSISKQNLRSAAIFIHFFRDILINPESCFAEKASYLGKWVEFQRNTTTVRYVALPY